MHEARRSNEALLSSLSTALKQESALVADVIAMLIEVEDRRLHLELACSSMFDFCTRRLGLSEGQTFRRLAAARLARTFPAILEAVRSRRLHLSSVALLRDLFTADNVDDLIAEAAGKPKSYVKGLVARLAPKPDAPTRIRRLPAPAVKTRVASVLAGSANAVDSDVLLVAAATTLGDIAAGGDDRGATTVVESSASGSANLTQPLQPASATQLAQPTRKIAVSDQIVPLSESRHKVQFTASTELRRKLERAQDLMRHRNIDGDLAVVVERALDLLITDLEKTRFAKTSRPKKGRALAAEHERKREREASADAGHDDVPRGPSAEPGTTTASVTAAVRREVVARDGERCTFTSAEGDRCPSRALIEVDHRHPRALGGDHTPSNLRLLCRAHNHYQAERVFGKAHVASAMARKKRTSAPAPTQPSTTPTQPKQPPLPFD